jgi:hypothetical protein
MMRDEGTDPDTSDVISSDTTGGEVRCKLGDVATGRGKYPDTLAMYCSGPAFVSVPNAPSPDGGACQAYSEREGDERKILGMRDNRFADKVGALSPGDAAIVSDCEARVLLRQADSSIIAMTQNQATGHTMHLALAGQSGAAQLVNGAAVIEITEDAEGARIMLGVSGGGSIVIDKDGVTILGPAIMAPCGTVQLGNPTGDGITPTPPLPIFGAGVGPAPVTIASQSVFISPK